MPLSSLSCLALLDLKSTFHLSQRLVAFSLLIRDRQIRRERILVTQRRTFVRESLTSFLSEKNFESSFRSGGGGRESIMTDENKDGKRGEELKSVAKEFTHQASLKLAEFSNDERVSKNFDQTLDTASEYLLDESAEAKIKQKAKELMETSDLAKKLQLKSQDLFDTSLRKEEDIETAKRRASQVLEIAESLAAKSASTSQTASVFAEATANLKRLIETSENRKELAEAAKVLGKEVWEKLGSRASANSNVSSMKTTVDRLSSRVRELLRKLQEDKKKREEEAAMAAVMGLSLIHI